MSNYSINPASGNNFQLIFPVLPFSSDLFTSKQLILQLINTGIPGLSFDKNTSDWNGKHINSINSDLNFEELELTFLIDENFENWKILYDWLTKINNNKDIVGKDLNEYSIDASLIVYNHYNSQILSLSYYNIFPISLDKVTLSYRDGENYLECTSTFSYDYFEVN